MSTDRRSETLSIVRVHTVRIRAGRGYPPTDGAKGTPAIVQHDRLSIVYGGRMIDAALTTLLETFVRKQRLPHGIASVATMDGSFSWSGVAKGPSVENVPTPQSPFWIASVTKMFVAAAVLRLVERGQIRLEDRLTDRLPQEITAGLHRDRGGTDRTQQITIRHLLGHASGLPEYIEVRPPGEHALFDRVLKEGDFAWSFEEVARIVRAAKHAHFAPQPTSGPRAGAGDELRAPKTKVRYSDTNYQLLIAIIERIIGHHIGDALAELVLRPLNLHDTYHPAVGPAHTGAAASPAPVFHGRHELRIPLAMQSFHDLYSTPANLTTFARALFGGLPTGAGLFEQPETAALMRTHWNRFGFMLSPVAPGWPIEYGLGLMRFQVPRFFSPLRPAPELIGHTGASGSWLFYYPALGLITSGTVNSVGAGAAPFRLAPALIRIVEDHLR